MQDSTARQLQVIALAQARNARHLRFAALVAVLVALLLWRTQWVTLRPGLIVLLIGQLGAALLLLYRNASLSRDLRRLQNTSSAAERSSLTWFDGEEAFVKRLALFENGLRLVGFALLAYGFWLPTRSIFIALAIGVAYPVTAYFGIGRRTTVRTLRDLEAQRNELQAASIP